MPASPVVYEPLLRSDLLLSDGPLDESVCSVGLELPRLHVVREADVEDVVPDQLEHPLVEDGEQDLHPGQEIAGHHVG